MMSCHPPNVANFPIPILVFKYIFNYPKLWCPVLFKLLLNAVYQFSQFIKLTGKLFKNKKKKKIIIIMEDNEKRVSITKLQDWETGG